MTDQYQQPPPQQYQPAPQPYQQPPKVNLADHFVGPGKLGMFILLSAMMMFIGVLFLDLCFSAVVTGDVRVLLFLGELLVDLGTIAILTLLILGGVSRTDLAENTRGMMLRAAGFGLGLYILAWSIRIMYSGILGSMMYY